MNRSDLQNLAGTRLADAKALLESKRWAGAYYLLGYVIECALKAVASRQFGQHEVPQKRVVNQFYTHRLDQLLDISGIKPDLERNTDADPDFQRYWATVCDWTEESRYDATITEAEARDLLTAVSNPDSGVLPWLKTKW
jgi:hypothetical protein